MVGHRKGGFLQGGGGIVLLTPEKSFLSGAKKEGPARISLTERSAKKGTKNTWSVPSQEKNGVLQILKIKMGLWHLPKEKNSLKEGKKLSYSPKIVPNPGVKFQKPGKGKDFL